MTWQDFFMLGGGLGLFLFGMKMMGDELERAAGNSLRHLLEVLTRNRLLGLLVGMLFTMLVQSSSATTVMVVGFVNAGLMDIYQAAGVIFGANVGTTITAMLASIGSSKAARRTALMHLLIKILNAIVFFIMVSFLPITEWVEMLTPNDPMRQIANAHMIFNIVGVICFFPFTNQLVKLVELIIPGEDNSIVAHRLQFLNDSSLKTPPAALAQAIKEIHRMQGLANQNIQVAIDLFVKGKADDSSCTDLEDREALINYLNHEITKYLVLINQTELSDHEGSLVGELFHVVNDIERIGDHAENIMELAQARERDKVVISDAGLLEINEMYAPVRELLETALSSFDSRDANRATRAYALEQRVDEMDELLRQRHIDRLNKSLCTPESGMLFTDVATNLERVADHAINIITAADMD